MPAIQSFDWYTQQVWSSLDQETRKSLTEKRDYLLRIRNEDERRRFTEEVMKEVRSKIRKASPSAPKN